MSTSSNATTNPLAASTLDSLPTIPPLDATFGAVLLGTFMGLVLYGLSLHQMYRYARLYPEDPRLLKILVIAIAFLETLHSVMNMHTCYYYLVSNFFHPEVLPRRGPWSISFLPVCGSAIMIVSQIFFARRVFLIGPKHRIVVAAAVFFLVAEIAFGTAGAIQANIVETYEQFYSLTWLISGCFACAAASDVLLTTALIVVLRQSRTGFKRTDSIIDVLIIYAINTGLLIGLFNVLSLILAAALPKNLIYVGFNILTAKLYANCFLAVLNSRKRLATRGMDIFDANSMKLNSIAARMQHIAAVQQYDVPQPAHPDPTLISIKVTTETVADVSGQEDSRQENDDKRLSMSA